MDVASSHGPLNTFFLNEKRESNDFVYLKFYAAALLLVLLGLVQVKVAVCSLWYFL